MSDSASVRRKESKETSPTADELKESGYRPKSSEELKNIEGYGKIGFEDSGYHPPPCAPPPAYEPPPQINFDSGANISTEEARIALLEKVAEHSCWGKRAAEGMKVNDIVPTDALHYKLETFTEGRTTSRREVTYSGGPIDGPENGPPPLPWAVPCQSNGSFKNHKYKIPVPHTDIIRMCGCCVGKGWNRCTRCNGCGQVSCTRCGGDGRITRHKESKAYPERCVTCGGDGRRSCQKCGGDGRVTCSHCTGYGKVKTFVQVTVKYINHVSDHILEETDMPDDLVKNVNGVQLMQQTAVQVGPLNSFPVQSINENASRLVELHRNSFPNEKQLQQRQTLRAVPVTEVACQWNKENLRFWVYGKERRVHVPDYPHQCCWGCTIL